jgi:hypothetical protein
VLLFTGASMMMLRYVMGVSSFVLCLNLQLALAISALQSTIMVSSVTLGYFPLNEKRVEHMIEKKTRNYHTSVKKLFALNMQTQAHAQPTAASSKYVSDAVCRSCILFYFTARFTPNFGHQIFTVTYHTCLKNCMNSNCIYL